MHANNIMCMCMAGHIKEQYIQDNYPKELLVALYPLPSCSGTARMINKTRNKFGNEKHVVTPTVYCGFLPHACNSFMINTHY